MRARTTLDNILEAAAQILEEEGPEVLTTANLSIRSGYAIGTVYQYLPTKEAIFHCLRDREAARVGIAIKSALEQRGVVTAQETAKRVVEAVVGGFSSRQTMRRYVIEQTVHANGMAALFAPLAEFRSNGRETPEEFIARHVLIGPIMAALFTNQDLLFDGHFRQELVRLLLLISADE